MSTANKKQKNQKKTLENLPSLTAIQKNSIDFVINNWQISHQNSLCALGVGLGKTRIACELIDWLTSSEIWNPKDYTLVCCSTAATRDTIWVDTLAHYDLNVEVLSGKDFEAIKLSHHKTLSFPPNTVCLITYANLIRSEHDGTPLITYFKKRPPLFIVFDEFHTLSNSFERDDQQYRNTVLELPNSLRLGLTATPLVNTSDEMVLSYALLNDINFCKTLLVRKSHEVTPVEEAFVRSKKFIDFKHLSFEGLHFDWLVSIPMSKELYDKYRELDILHESDGLVNQQNEALRFLVEGKYGQGDTRIECKAPTGKMQALRAIIEHVNPSDKIVVFDNFIHTLDFIAKQDWIREFQPVVHHGRKSKNANDMSYKRFMNEGDVRIFLTTRSQCAEGINLQIANHVIIMNCWWTAKDLIQMIGRIKRQDQKKPVYSYLLGYNRYSLVANKKNCTKEDVFLPEEMNQYETIKEKVKISRVWDMEYSEQLPEPMPFQDPATFEQDFSEWLQNRILPGAPHLAADGTEEDRVVEEKQKQWEEQRKRWEFFLLNNYFQHQT